MLELYKQKGGEHNESNNIRTGKIVVMDNGYVWFVNKKWNTGNR